ncbi:MAG: glycosyltransferase [Bacillota bacterium]
MSVARPKVTVVVVARNEERNISACIGSLAAQDYAAFSVILVDDGSTDRTVELARRALPSIRVISSPTRSISRNREIGWRSAKTDFVAFLDADCEAPPHWLSSLVSAALATGAAAVGGGNRPPSGESAHYDALALMLQTFLGSRDSIQGRLPKEGRFVEHLPGLNVLYRTECLRLVDGYDPRFARMGEDEDLSRRMTDVGLRLYVTPEATVIHRQRADLASWFRNMRAYGRGRTWLLRRHPNAVSPLFLLPPLIIPSLPVYLPLIAVYAAWLALRASRPALAVRLFRLFVATHVAYGIGQVEGLFIRGDNEMARAKRHRVGLIALKNAGNRGDEAICACVTRRLVETAVRGAGPVDFYLAALGPSGFDVRPVPAGERARELMIADMLAPNSSSRGVGEQSLLALPRLLSVLAGFRAIVIAGGQWLHDLSLAKHAAVCGIFAFARLCRTRTGVFCIGAGPLRRPFSRALVRLAFSRSSLVVTRDEASTALLRDCGLKQAQTATDPAIDLQSSVAAGREGAVLLSPCAWSSFENLYAQDGGEIEESVRRWRKLLRRLQSAGERVAILPTMNPEDAQFAARLTKGLKGIEVIDTDALTPSQVQSVIGQAKALISMRLHPLIFASNVETPFVAIAYAEKVGAYCAQAGAASRLLSIRDADWPSKAGALLAEPVDERQTSDARNRQARALANAYSEFFRWLDLEPKTAPHRAQGAVQLS